MHPNGNPGDGVRAFDATLDRTGGNMRAVEADLAEVRAKVREARAALETPGRVRDDAAVIEDKIEQLQVVLKSLAKAPALKLIANGLDRVLEQAERVANGIERQADRVQDRIDRTGIIDDLKDVEDRIADKEDRVAEQTVRVDDFGDATTNFVGAVDLLAPRTDSLARSADAVVHAPNEAAIVVNEIYETLDEVAVERVLATIRRADFTPVIGIGDDFARIKELVCAIEPVLNVAYGAVRPIEPLLNAVGFVFELTVEPVLDFLIETLGIDRLMDRIGASIEALLPDFTPLFTLDNRLEGVLPDLDRLLDVDFQIDIEPDIDVFTKLSRDVLTPLGPSAASPVKIGAEPGETIEGGADADLIDPRGGDDTVRLLGGDDVAIASPGDDAVEGGAGEDTVVFRDFFSSYRFRDLLENPTRLTVEHVAPTPEVDDGTERLVGVEIVEFAGGFETTTAALVANTVDARPGYVGDGDDEFIYANGSGTYDGAGGDDWIAGSAGPDTLLGGPGDDTFDPGLGRDVVDGGPGIDTWVMTEAGSRGSVVNVYFDDERFGDFEPDTVRNVENVLIQRRASSHIRADDADNVLRTTRGETVIEAHGGDDTLIGTDGRDALIGGDGYDAVYGRGGRDELFAGGAVPVDRSRGDFYDGGEGRSDALIYSNDDVFYTNAFDSRVRFLEERPPAGPIRLDVATGRVERLSADRASVIATDTYANVEVFVGSDADDVLTGAVLTPEGEEVTLNGADGDDEIFVNGARVAYGGYGSDRIVPSGTVFSFQGTSFAGGVDFDDDDAGTVDTLDMRPSGLRWSLWEGAGGGGQFRAYTPAELAALGEGALPTDRATQVNRGTYDGFEVFLLGDEDDEAAMRQAGERTVFGGAGNDRLSSEDGDGAVLVTFHGEDGDDVLALGGDGGNAYGGAGDDVIDYGGDDGFGAPRAEIFGGPGDDVVRLSRGDNLVVDGGPGFDAFGFTFDIGEKRVDFAAGTFALLSDEFFGLSGTVTGFEVFLGSDAREIVDGSDGDNRLLGNGGNDVLRGRDGRNELYGGASNDSLEGGWGDDLLHGGAGPDVLYGAPSDRTGRTPLPDDPSDTGTDTASYATAVPRGRDGALAISSQGFAGAFVDLAAGRGRLGSGPDDRLIGIENVVGTQFDDELRGDGGDNALSGGAGDDVLRGGAGDDVLSPGAGDDALFGGAGDDVFVLDRGDNAFDGGGNDPILGPGDFGDVLDLGAVDGDVVIDFAAGTYVATFSVERAVWRDTGTEEARTVLDVEGVRSPYTPQEILESRPAYASSGRTQVDETALPRGGGIAIALGEETYAGTFAGIEAIRGGTGRTTLIPAEDRAVRFDGSAAESTRNLLALAPAGPQGARLDLATGASSAPALTTPYFAEVDGVVGTAGPDDISGGPAGDTLLGGDGDDRLEGQGGDDTLGGEGGDDVVLGGAGLDTIVFEGAFGGDLVDDPDRAGTLRFADAARRDVALLEERDGDLFVATVGAGLQGTVLFPDYFSGGRAWRFEFADGPDALGDLDGDATGDVLFYAPATRALGYWAMEAGAARWRPVDLAPGPGWEVAGIGDFSTDGAADVLWRNAGSGALGYFEMLGEDAWWRPLGRGGAGFEVAGVGDLDGDGDDDVLWHDRAGGVAGYWEVEGAGRAWVQIARGVGAAWAVEAVGDVDGDGTDDVVWRNGSSRDVGYWAMEDGAATWKPLAERTGAGWDILATADLDGDGDEDVLWFDPGSNRLGRFDMEGGAAVWAPIGRGGAGWSPQAVGDYDGDGTDDVLWRQEATGAVGFFRMVDGAPEWRGIATAGLAFEIESGWSGAGMA